MEKARAFPNNYRNLVSNFVNLLSCVVLDTDKKWEFASHFFLRLFEYMTLINVNHRGVDIQVL